MNEVTTLAVDNYWPALLTALLMISIWSITGFILLTHSTEEQPARGCMRDAKCSARCLAPAALSVVGMLVWVFMASNALA
jgi:hypothetical protein